MFIIEDHSSKWTDRSWFWTVVIYLVLLHFTALTMHVRYNPDRSLAKKARMAGRKPRLAWDWRKAADKLDR
jgi:hypothetical protein